MAPPCDVPCARRRWNGLAGCAVACRCAQEVREFGPGSEALIKAVREAVEGLELAVLTPHATLDPPASDAARRSTVPRQPSWIIDHQFCRPSSLSVAGNSTRRLIAVRPPTSASVTVA